MCRTAAHERLAIVTEFVRSLRPEHLQSFWYSASKYCFATVGTFIGLLWVTASSKEEAESYKEKLEEYRWTLRLSSKSAEFLDRAISILTTSTGMLIKSIPEQQLSANEDIRPTSEEQNLSHNEASKEEEWSAEQASNSDNMSLQPSPTQFSEEAMEMLWPGFAMGNDPYAIPEQSVLQTGFSMQPFIGIGSDFDVPAAYQPQYGVSGPADL